MTCHGSEVMYLEYKQQFIVRNVFVRVLSRKTHEKLKNKYFLSAEWVQEEAQRQPKTCQTVRTNTINMYNVASRVHLYYFLSKVLKHILQKYLPVGIFCKFSHNFLSRSTLSFILLHSMLVPNCQSHKIAWKLGLQVSFWQKNEYFRKFFYILFSQIFSII